MSLYIARAAFGRGVFSERQIAAGAEIERTPVIVVPSNVVEALQETPLADYWFAWGENDSEAAIALGYGSFYNHSENANAAFENREAEGDISFGALRDIAPGEEITVDYSAGDPVRYPVWFSHRCETSHARLADAVAMTPAVRIARSRGASEVYANCQFAERDIIERAPVILMPDSACRALDRTVLSAVCHVWDDGRSAVGLGALPLYRRCREPTARMMARGDSDVIEVIALRDLSAGDEITLEWSRSGRSLFSP